MILYAIWQIQTDRKAGKATISSIQEKTDFSASEVNGCFHSLRQISKTYYFRTIQKRNPASYRLSTDYLVTQSDTAKILLGLFEFPEGQVREGQVPFDAFVDYAAKNFGLSKELIIDRLEKSIKQQYLTRVQREQWYLEINSRLICEKEYLSMLAQNFVLKLPSATA